MSTRRNLRWLRVVARVAPGEVLSIVQDQILKIAHTKNGGLLTLGMMGAIWSTSSGVTAIIDTLNQAYDIQEGRSWWKVKAIALGLTMALAVFIVVSFALVLVGPTVAELAQPLTEMPEHPNEALLKSVG